MNNFLEKVEERLDDMITNRPRFKEATRKFFEAADTDRNERVSQHEAAAQVPLIFDMIQADLDEYGIKVVKPTKEEVMAYLEDDECDSEWAMDFEEFEDFYLQVVKLAALKSAQGFVVKYKWSMLLGTAGVFLCKRVIRRIPLAGLLASPFLALVPSFLVGPVIGVAVNYGLDKGDLFAAKKKLFPAKRSDDEGDYDYDDDECDDYGYYGGECE